MKLNQTQANIVQLIANAELRTSEQMLSLLLAEGIKLYFCDYEPPFSHVELNIERAEEMLKEDAMRCVQATPTSNS